MVEVGGGGRREIYRVEVGGLQMDGINIWRFFLSHSATGTLVGYTRLGLLRQQVFPYVSPGPESPGYRT